MKGLPNAPAGGGLLQISDPHFGTEQPGAVEALVRLVQRRQPALVLLSGDVTQRATAAQFTAARALCDRLQPVPVIAVPGNHDIPLFALWTRLRRPYARFEAALGPAGDKAWAGPGWQVLLLNTTRWWRHKHGEVSQRQVQATAAQLAAAGPGVLKVVVTHQPVAVPAQADRVDLLRGGAAAIAAWHAAGADLVLGGHIHLPCVLPLRPAPQPMWAVLAGTAVSTRVRHGTHNSVTELLPGQGSVLRWPAALGSSASGPGAGDAGQRSCTVRFWDWPPGQQDYVARPDIELPLASRAQGVRP